MKQTTMNYLEKEIKVLDVDVEKLRKRLMILNAQNVYVGQRIISTFDYDDGRCKNKDILVRLTEENTIKLTVHINNSALDGMRKIIKLHPVENAVICKDFLLALGLQRNTYVISKRISYELNKIDFDIDEFPCIPPFVEIDIENLQIPLYKLLVDLGLENNKVVNCGTEEIFRMYGIDYYSLFAIK